MFLSSLLPSRVWLVLAVSRYESFPMQVDPARIARSESLVWLLLVVLVVTLGLVTLFVWCAWRQFRQPTPEAELIDEILRNENARGRVSPPAAPAGQEWERDGDWWKADREADGTQ